MVAVQPCPICATPVLLAGDAASPHRPFCSRRCKLLDIGAWADGQYRISRPLDLEDLDVLRDPVLPDAAPDAASR